MLHSISVKVAHFLYNKKCCESEYIDAYVYGVELIISSVLGLLLIFSISLLINRLLFGLVFYLCFASLRHYTGGLHCNSYLRCNITFASCYLMCVICDYVLSYNTQLELMLIPYYIISFVIILYFSPIENGNKEICKDEKIKFKFFSLLVFLFQFLIIIVDFVFFMKIYRTIIITNILVAVLMLLGYIKNKREVRI